MNDSRRQMSDFPEKEKQVDPVPKHGFGGLAVVSERLKEMSFLEQLSRT